MFRWLYGVDAATVIETWEMDQWTAHKRFADQMLERMSGGGQGGD